MVLTSEWINSDRYFEYLLERQFQQSTIYHKKIWLEILSQSFGAEIRFAHTKDENGLTLAVTPFMTKRKSFFRLIGSPLSGLYTQFMGPVFAYNLSKAELLAVIQSQHSLLSSGAHYIEWGFKGEFAVECWVKKLEPIGYSYVPRSTLLIDLSIGKIGVWDSFMGRARNMVRKAEKAGVVARTINPTETWMISYYQMLQATFGRQGLSVPHPLSFFLALLEIAKLGGLRCVIAEFDGRLIAGGIFLIDGSRMLYLSGAANSEGMKLAGTSLLQWYAMQMAIKDGVVDYDMGGLGVPSIDKFKRSFGGREVRHPRWVYQSPLFRLAMPLAKFAARKGLIRMWGD